MANAMPQLLLFPDPRPLVEKLGADFFRTLPETAGVYLMKDGSDTVLYIGKAKNLRKRLGSYRVANPDRMARRHLRLLRAVTRIELRDCRDEESARAKESELLRMHRPRFNRAGTWPATQRFVLCREAGEHLQLAVAEKVEAGWDFGEFGSRTRYLREVLVRLLWYGLHPERGMSALPLGWADDGVPGVVSIQAGSAAAELAGLVRTVLCKQPEVFVQWVRSHAPDNPHPFDRAAIESDLESISEWVR